MRKLKRNRSVTQSPDAAAATGHNVSLGGIGRTYRGGKTQDTFDSSGEDLVNNDFTGCEYCNWCY